MRATPLTRPDRSTEVTVPANSVPAGRTVAPPPETDSRSSARTTSSTLLVSEATADCSRRGRVVPAGSVTSRNAGGAGAAGSAAAGRTGAAAAAGLLPLAAPSLVQLLRRPLVLPWWPPASQPRSSPPGRRLLRPHNPHTYWPRPIRLPIASRILLRSDLFGHSSRYV